MKNKRGYLFLLVFALVICLNACGVSPDSLGSSERKVAVESALKIYRGADKLRVTEAQIPGYLRLLHFDKAFVSGAAEVALIRAGETALPELVAQITDDGSYRNHLENRIDFILQSTNLLESPYLDGKAVCYAADALFEAGSSNTVRLLQAANRMAEEWTNETEKNVLKSMIAARYYRYGDPYGYTMLTNFIAVVSKISSEYRRSEVIRTLALELASMNGDEAQKIRFKLADMAGRFWEQRYRAKAMAGLAVSAAAHDPSSAARWTYAIYNGYNKEDYGLILQAAEAFARAGETARAIEFYRLALQAAQAIREPVQSALAERDSAVSWASMLPEYCWEAAERLASDTQALNALLTILAENSIGTDFTRAVYYASLIVSESDRLPVLADLREFALQNPGSVSREDEERLNGLILLLSNRAPVEAREALVDTMHNPTNGQRYLDNVGWPSVERFRILTAYAEGMAGIDADESEDAWNSLMTLLQGTWGYENKFTLMQSACDAVLNLRTASPYPMIEQIKMIALAITNEELKADTLLMLGEKFFPYDRETALSFVDGVDKTQKLALISNWISVEAEEYRTPPEFEVLAAIAAQAQPALVASVLSNRAKASKAVAALTYIASKPGLADYGSLSELTPLLADTNLPVAFRASVLEAAAGTPDPAFQKAVFVILTNKAEPELKTLVERIITYRGFDAGTLLPVLSAVLTNRSSSAEDKRVAVFLAGYAKGAEAQSLLNGVLKQYQLADLSRTAIAGLVRMQAAISPEIAGRFLSDGVSAPMLFDALGRQAETSALRSLYSNYYYNNYYRDLIVRSLSLYQPGSRKHPRLGYTGYSNAYVIYCFQMKGYDCVPVENAEDAKAKGCDLLLEGRYDIAYGNEEITYVDAYAPGGAANVKSEEHRASIKLKTLDGSVLWSVNAYGLGAAWSEELFSITEEVDLQEVVSLEGRKWLEQELYKRMQSSRDSIPFNF